MDRESLRLLMESNNLNVKKLAALLGVANRTVYNWLEGTRNMPAMAVELLKIKLGEVDK